MDTASDGVEKKHRKMLSDLVWELHKLEGATYSMCVEDGAQGAFCDWAEAYWEKADQPTTKPLLAALYNKLPDHAAKLSGILHLVHEYDPRAVIFLPRPTIPLSVIQLATASWPLRSTDVRSEPLSSPSAELRILRRDTRKKRRMRLA